MDSWLGTYTGSIVPTFWNQRVECDTSKISLVSDFLVGLGKNNEGHAFSWPQWSFFHWYGRKILQKKNPSVFTVVISISTFSHSSDGC